MAFTNLLTAIYPVGSLYLFTVSTSPATIIGGTWTPITGAVLACTGSNSFAGTTSFGGSLAIAKSNLPPGHVRFRTIALGDYNLIQSATGVFEKTLEAWSGTHGALSLENYTPYYNEYLEFGGGGRISFPTILRFMDGTELLNLLGGE